MNKKAELYDHDLSGAAWRKSSASGPENNCVEIADLPEGVAVRDSKEPAGHVLRFTAAEWTAFRAGVLTGKL